MKGECSFQKKLVPSHWVTVSLSYTQHFGCQISVKRSSGRFMHQERCIQADSASDIRASEHQKSWSRSYLGTQRVCTISVIYLHFEDNEIKEAGRVLAIDSNKSSLPPAFTVRKLCRLATVTVNIQSSQKNFNTVKPSEASRTRLHVIDICQWAVSLVASYF